MNKLLVICGPTATGKTALAAKLAKQLNGELISADSRQAYVGRDLETNKERPDVRIWLYDIVNPGEEFSVSHWVKLARLAIEDIQKRNKLPIVVGGSGLYIKALLDPFDTIDIPPNRKLREKLQTFSVDKLQNMVVRGNMNESDWNNLGLRAPLPALYKRIDDHMKERIQKGMKEIPSNEHAIARKQLTWFKKQKGIHWFDCTSPTLERDVIYLLRHAQKD
ncbi:MAG: tRNA delta(2)-isopentenylpyrophosphate transferase, tRNA dimethylallyltransferase [Microgenomates group bacterium GW2011_GWC1_49_7]|nr:MAG: tRNA delta(2)-isopentenylpyrophosphate transferase, tRNA dimethylallyltransferase [Microgenomates group bacterium GW2011_GWC1_49_7]